jgi:hypothetical protein
VFHGIGEYELTTPKLRGAHDIGEADADENPRWRGHSDRRATQAYYHCSSARDTPRAAVLTLYHCLDSADAHIEYRRERVEGWDVQGSPADGTAALSPRPLSDAGGAERVPAGSLR